MTTWSLEKPNTRQFVSIASQACTCRCDTKFTFLTKRRCHDKCVLLVGTNAFM